MALVVPVFPGEPLYNERVRLEDRDFIFRFDWNNREGRFYMGIANQDEDSLIAGVKVVANWGLLTNHQHNPGLPPGLLIPIDLEQGGTPPTFRDFGTRVRLFYYASDEDLSVFAP